jgi:glutathione reductase (NADPH)
MAEFDYDLFVIGGGSGGVRAARIAAGHGARVAIAEEYRYGGTCVIRGCIPKKLFVYASHYSHDFEDAKNYGWTVGKPEFDWPTLRDNKDREIDRLNKIYIRLLEKSGVDVFHCRATLADEHTIICDDKRVTARVILVASGGTPFMPDIEGIEHAITSNEAFHLDTLPEHITIVGGGYIAVEFAGIFRGLGCNVCLVHRRSEVLRGFDEDIRDIVTDNLRKQGVTLHLDRVVESIASGESSTLSVSVSKSSTVQTGAILFATGRTPNTAAMGLEKAGVLLNERGAVVVDEYSRSSAKHIYAVGDVTDRIQLTPVAIREGHSFADSVFGGDRRPVDHKFVPSAVFSQPPVATVGMTEIEAHHEVGAIDIYKSTFRPLIHTLSGRDEKTMMKLVVCAKSQKVLGAHMVGKDAAEIIQPMAIALRMGATKQDLDSTTALHPTTAEEFVLMRTKYEPPLPSS